jgi:hypothetical protein
VKLEPSELRDEALASCTFPLVYISSLYLGKPEIVEVWFPIVAVLSENVMFPKSGNVLILLLTVGRSTTHSADKREEL